MPHLEEPFVVGFLVFLRTEHPTVICLVIVHQRHRVLSPLNVLSGEVVVHTDNNVTMCQVPIVVRPAFSSKLSRMLYSLSVPSNMETRKSDIG